MQMNSSCFNLDINFDIEALYTTNIVTAVVNSVFSLTAVLGNFVIIMAYQRTPSLHCPANTLLCCLALSDFIVGLLAQPSFVAHKGEIQRNVNMYCATRIITETAGYIACGVSILTLTPISIERYFAVYFHLRYKEIVTNFRALETVGILWFTMSLVAGARFFSMKDGKKFKTVTIPILFSSLIITISPYSRVYMQVRRHQRCIQDQEKSARIKSSESRDAERKSVVTMTDILGLFVFSNEPMIAVVITHKVTGYTRSVKEAYIYVSTIVFVCSSINPMIYCWRTTEIR
ncbi:melanocortin receptor 3-like [Stylophora pistillata]|uniref:melanocortin receptor 3-like n=1 Tax=Stylophora pistillata TaxID=50429 RepID=UPI000C04338C|nr:melanocortin receptor 3-like [Stylophora pistillata]